MNMRRLLLSALITFQLPAVKTFWQASKPFVCSGSPWLHERLAHFSGCRYIISKFALNIQISASTKQQYHIGLEYLLVSAFAGHI